MFEAISTPKSPNWKLRLAALTAVLVLIAGLVWLLRMTQMPGKSQAGPLSPVSTGEAELAKRLSTHVLYLSQTIGERNLSRSETLQASTAYLRTTLQQIGYQVTEQPYLVHGQTVSNLEVTLPGNASSETVVVGAHYDSVAGTVGANDNATGVAALLELASLLHEVKARKTIRLVFFVNEEPPYFQTDDMGSAVYAKQLRRDHTRVSAMISLETIGYYSDSPGTQKYPPILSLFYPSRGNFIGFVGNSESRDLTRQAIRTFRETTNFPSEGVAAPSDWPGIGWSDQWSFWQQGYPAIMITDTAVFRYPYYHTPLDTMDRVDFGKMARIVEGVQRVVESLAN
jgi:hypothetical protein